MSDVIVGGVTVMKNTTRALRRHHHERMVQKAMRLPYLRFNYEMHYCDHSDLRSRARSVSDNMAQCSCWSCCNIRSSGWIGGLDRLTFNERRNLDSFNDQMEDLDFPEDLGDNTQTWLNDEQ